MDKSIHILYNSKDKSTANRIYDILTASSYHAKTIELDEADFLAYLSGVKPSDCQLIISVNLAGFAGSSSDGGATINRTPINVVSLLTVSPESYAPYFQRRINYTISFLVPTDKDRDYMRKEFPHLYHIDTLSDPLKLPGYLDSMDWRF